MSRRVYVVEDGLGLSLAELVESLEGFALCGANHSAEAALEELLEMQPDVLLTVMSLPGISGAELVSKARNLVPELACVVVSGSSSARSAAKALAAGAGAWIAKTEIRRLEQVLGNVLEVNAPFFAYGIRGR